MLLTAFFLWFTILRVPGFEEKAVRWFADAPWQRFFCGVLFCGRQSLKKSQHSGFWMLLDSVFFLWCTILRAPGFEEKATRWFRMLLDSVFFSVILFSWCQGLKKSQHSGLRMLLDSVFSLVYYFAGARV
jgi:hypothetical protein